ncbi:hypothetical protein [Chitinibacter sp. S2-10]|uniref:hypothetical protein n=1 Tax=Chitinibacter sp. S2-10 TaxID=3373597 RepID=UPI00397793B5
MLRFLTNLSGYLHDAFAGAKYDAFSHSPFYLHSNWQEPRLSPPEHCEEETLEQLRDRWRMH